MALDAVMWVTDGGGNRIQGSNEQAGLEGSSLVSGFQQQLDHPYDVQSGRSTGRPQHSVLVVTKAIDKASPVLIQAWADGTKLQRVDIWCYEAQPDGTESNYYTIRLVGVRVYSHRCEQLNNKYPENLTHPVREHVGFAYETIEWIYNDGRLSALDEWLSARQS